LKFINLMTLEEGVRMDYHYQAEHLGTPQSDYVLWAAETIDSLTPKYQGREGRVRKRMQAFVIPGDVEGHFSTEELESLLAENESRYQALLSEDRSTRDNADVREMREGIWSKMLQSYPDVALGHIAADDLGVTSYASEEVDQLLSYIQHAQDSMERLQTGIRQRSLQSYEKMTGSLSDENFSLMSDASDFCDLFDIEDVQKLDPIERLHLGQVVLRRDLPGIMDQKGTADIIYTYAEKLFDVFTSVATNNVSTRDPEEFANVFNATANLLNDYFDIAFVSDRCEKEKREVNSHRTELIARKSWLIMRPTTRAAADSPAIFFKTEYLSPDEKVEKVAAWLDTHDTAKHAKALRSELSGFLAVEKILSPESLAVVEGMYGRSAKLLSKTTGEYAAVDVFAAGKITGAYPIIEPSVIVEEGIPINDTPLVEVVHEKPSRSIWGKVKGTLAVAAFGLAGMLAAYVTQDPIPAPRPVKSIPEVVDLSQIREQPEQKSLDRLIEMTPLKITASAEPLNFTEEETAASSDYQIQTITIEKGSVPWRIAKELSEKDPDHRATKEWVKILMGENEVSEMDSNWWIAGKEARVPYFPGTD